MAIEKPIDPKKLRADLVKLLPGFKWTVHQPQFHSMKHQDIKATGIQSSGFNRLATITVRFMPPEAKGPWFEVKGFGHGTRGSLQGSGNGRTLTNAVRGLQEHYEHQANIYRSLADGLEAARKA